MIGTLLQRWSSANWSECFCYQLVALTGLFVMAGIVRRGDAARPGAIANPACRAAVDPNTLPYTLPRRRCLPPAWSTAGSLPTTRFLAVKSAGHGSAV